MPLFGGRRDISLFRHINRELYDKIITQVVDIFKASLYNSQENLYGEVLNKQYFPGVRLCGLVGPEDQTSEYEDQNVDVDQLSTYYFLRDDLIKKNIVLEIGDVIHWNNIYWEVDKAVENKFFMGRNPAANKIIGPNWGWNLAVVCNTHQTKRSTVKLEKIRTANSKQNKSTSKKDKFY